MEQKKVNYTLRCQQAAIQLISVLETLRSLSDEWIANGYGIGASNEITDQDLHSEYGLAMRLGYLNAEALSGFMVSAEAFLTLLGQGHATNLNKLKNI